MGSPYAYRLLFLAHTHMGCPYRYCGIPLVCPYVYECLYTYGQPRASPHMRIYECPCIRIRVWVVAAQSMHTAPRHLATPVVSRGQTLFRVGALSLQYKRPARKRVWSSSPLQWPALAAVMCVNQSRDSVTRLICRV